MQLTRNTISGFLLLAGLVGSSASAADELPAPIQALADQGLEIHGNSMPPAGCAATAPACRVRTWRFT